MNRCELCDTSRQRKQLVKYDDMMGPVCTRQHIPTCTMRQARRDPVREHVRKRKAASYQRAFEHEITRRAGELLP